jgi:dolichol-phosphate mannosyltransferase
MNNICEKKITALIPCYNEEGGIADVISSFPHDEIARQGYSIEIVVIDNNSTDRTAEIAKSLGATVIHERNKGKGKAMRRGFAHVSSDTDYVVMLDGDATYRPEEILRMVEPLRSGFANVVIGSRLQGKISKGSMEPINRIGNWIYSHLVRYVYRVNVTDALTGYFAWTYDAAKRLYPHLTSSGFAIEMEMVTKMALLNEEICSVPISYYERAGHSNLSPVRDGIRILWMFTKTLFWKPEASEWILDLRFKRKLN